jgi:hypothetical protein
VLEFVLLYLQENKKVNYILFAMVLSSGMQKLGLILREEIIIGRRSVFKSYIRASVSRRRSALPETPHLK